MTYSIEILPEFGLVEEITTEQKRRWWIGEDIDSKGRAKRGTTSRKQQKSGSRRAAKQERRGAGKEALLMLATVLVSQEESRAMHDSELWFLRDFW